ncbi:MAG: hypothetical protein J0L82_15455 [Deltaproteobacteria bacterium]|nr:hypothetical protein [Deltaproteobacteria bacterium]
MRTQPKTRTYLAAAYMALNLLAPLTFAAATEAAPEANPESYLSVHVYSSPSKTIGRDVDLTQSHIGIDWGNIKPSDVVDAQLGKESFSRSEYFFSFSFKFSAVPYLLADSTEEQLDEHLAEIIAAKREAALVMVTKQVDSALKQNFNFGLLSPAQQDLMRNKMVINAMTGVDESLNKVLEEKKIQNHSRIRQIRAETSFQEIALTFGKVIQNGSSVVFFKFGKYTPDLGSPRNPMTNTTELEDLRASNSVTQRGGDSAATGAMQLSYIRKLGPALAVRVDAYLLHERYPWISGEGNIAARATLDSETFDRQAEIFKIDSKAVRVLLQHNRGNVYATVIDYAGTIGHKGHHVYQTGATLRIHPDMNVYLDYYRGDRKNLRRGASGFVAYRVTEAVTIFAGVEKNIDSYRPELTARNEGTISYRDVVLGLQAVLYDKKLWKGKLKVVASGEAIDRHTNDEANDKWFYTLGLKLLYAY